MHYNAEDLQSILLQKRYKLFAKIKIIYYFCAENPWQYKKNDVNANTKTAILK